MPRLPVPGGDEDAWGAILNEFLEVAHAASGEINTPTRVYALSLTASNGTPQQIDIWSDGHIYFANDISLYRPSATVIRASGALQATAFTVVAAAKPGEEPDDEVGINLLDLIDRLTDRVAELEAKLAE